MKTTTKLIHRLPLFALVFGLMLTLGARVATAASASPPDLMSYQGFLVDVNGAALAPTAPANYPIVFRIYDASTGGNILWSEQQVVTVDKGNFSVVLGEGTAVSGEARPALSSAFAGVDASDRYLGITVTISGTTMTISPRLRLLPSPYAFAATKAIALANSSGVNLINTSGANVGIGTTTPGARLEVNVSSSSSSSPAFKMELAGANLLAYKSGASSTTLENTAGGGLNLQTQGGNVGIGTSSPAATLDVRGDCIFQQGGGTTLTIQTPASDARIYASGTSTRLLLNPSGGNVGIGTTSPNGGLDVLGGNGGTTRFQLFGEGGTFPYYALRARNGADTAYVDTVIRTDDFVVETGTTGNATTQRFRITDSGNVGINTANPSATLHVNGNMKIEGANTLEFGAGVAGKSGDSGKIGYQTFSPGNPGMLDIVGAGIPNTSRYVKLWDALYINGWAVSPNFITQSDARIKQITGRPVGATSLESIRGLRVTDFRFLDTKLHGETPRRGFIAQEVENVLPNAVTQSRDFVPDINASAISSQYDAGDKTLTIDLKNPHGLNPGDMVRLNLDHDQKTAKVMAVPSTTRFVVAAENQPGKVFVFGKQVNDFRTVDYNHVFATGISAIQELDRQVQALKKSEARIAELEQKTARMAELEQKATRVDSLEREVAELKKLVVDLAAVTRKSSAPVGEMSRVAASVASAKE